MSLENNTPAVQADTIPYSGFWRRVVAFVIDSIIASFPVYLLAFPCFLILAVQTTQQGNEEISAVVFSLFSLFFNFLSLLSFWLYFSFLESGKHQATWGKRILGIKVVNEHGEKISFANATGRFFAKILSYLCLYIGFLFVPFTNRKRALHDMVASTYVVKADYQPGQPLPPTPSHIGTLVAVCIGFGGLMLVFTFLAFLMIATGA
ncbi:MAG: RDD family protein [Elusimicrobiaceae bacterium]|nr:RDD family protein [Elusimicrobiaceae bacterium]